MSTITGTLFIVATPIGNLTDITSRAIDVLKSVDYIVCEDTRVTGKLLSHYLINKKMVAMNDFNEQRRVPEIVSSLAAGGKIALVSDAGTPLISDPGYKLVREAIAKNIKVESVPGPSAVIAALAVSGLAPDKFLFLGYLPKKDVKRKKMLSTLSTILHSMRDNKLRTTVIAFETPYRLLATLEDIKEVFGDIEIAVCREMTKMHEEVRREKVSQSIDYFSKATKKGEFVILF